MYSFQITYNIFYARDIDNKLWEVATSAEDLYLILSTHTVANKYL